MFKYAGGSNMNLSEDEREFFTLKNKIKNHHHLTFVYFFKWNQTVHEYGG